MTSVIKPKTPTGTLELLPAEQAAFDAMLAAIRTGFERHGFTAIETPVFEESEILLTKSGGETEKQVYFVQSSGSIKEGHQPDLALRFDLTVPLARYVAEHQNELAFPFRRYQIQRVYRGERAQKGRFREFLQCDIDVVGRETLSIAHDAEMPVIIAGIFRELDIGKFKIHVSNRKILKGYFENFGNNIKSVGDTYLILREIDKANKIGWEVVKENISKLFGGDLKDNINSLINILSAQASALDHIRQLKQLCSGNVLAEQGIQELETVLSITASMSVGEDIICFNPAITRGLDYYTGTVYETFLEGHEDWGSICSGGRYDNLAGFYTRQRLPGVGISIGFTRLFDQLRKSDRKIIERAASPTKVLVAWMGAELQKDARHFAQELRSAGINTALYLEDDKFDKQLKYAEKAGIPLLLIYGAQEKAKGEVAVRDMKTGEKKTLPLSGIGGALKKFL